MFYQSGAKTQDGGHGRLTIWPARGGAGLNGGQNGQHGRAVRLDPAASTGDEKSGTLTLTGIPRQRWRGGGPGCSGDHVRPQDATSQDVACRSTHPHSSSGSGLCPAGICARSWWQAAEHLLGLPPAHSPAQPEPEVSSRRTWEEPATLLLEVPKGPRLPVYRRRACWWWRRWTSCW